jgi:hypothetical protein
MMMRRIAAVLAAVVAANLSIAAWAEGGAAAATHPGAQAASRPAAVVLAGTAIPQVDHNAVLDRSKYILLLEVAGEADAIAKYAVRINDVSTAFIGKDKGAKPVIITGVVTEEGGMKVITPSAIQRQTIPIEKR